MVGAALVLPEAGREKIRVIGRQFMAHGHVSVWNAVPALMQMLCEYHSGDRMSYPTLRLALLSGDWIPLTLPSRCASGSMKRWTSSVWVERPSAPSGRSTTR